ncbi:MAG TPA: hypothetical protein VF120_14870 [Ktedonobacterales bacterium]
MPIRYGRTRVGKMLALRQAILQNVVALRPLSSMPQPMERPLLQNHLDEDAIAALKVPAHDADGLKVRERSPND